MRKLALLLALPLALSACGAGQTHIAFVKPPPDKLACADEPGRPVGSGPEYTDAQGVVRHQITDEDNATYLRSLRGAGGDCREKVDWLRDWFARLKE